ncbi:MAG: ABC transporter substrate-binding protein [Desulfofustis sp.]|nr:ABC transporter substrate-binding protein [Desulfofustis sp.]RZW19744.1 MAG: ABC transporter substrate-binding protein [Desulfobulbaceae bacterium]MBT8344695.1 ABC transporter substrate-binding protein [Desulfofustis sp.]MBT8355097.1 ABC transporter substrate-binding protein [Desulfofustis sp.]NNF48077.1 ABC transporter substrate-binding protein [Desulfofustis sp.]
MKHFVTTAFVFFYLALTGLNLCADDHSPTEQLQPVLNQLIEVLDDESLKGDALREKRRGKIMAIIASVFDFKEMSRRVLGRTWNEISEKDQQYFVTQFTKLLENVYIGKLESYGGRSYEFVAERIKGKRAQVTTLIPYEESKIPVHYIMQRELDKWMVYDINIEGVSLVRNYMEQFRTILSKEQYDGLIKIIEDKNKSFAEENRRG